MKEQDYQIKLNVNVSAEEAFQCINNVSQWWTDDMEGDSHQSGDSFTVHFADIHVSTQKIVELIPNQKVVWLVTSSQLNFLKDKEEWNNTTIHFEIEEKDGQTEVRFTHVGLVPQIECYEACTGGWDHFIKGSLYKLLMEGKGQPGLM